MHARQVQSEMLHDVRTVLEQFRIRIDADRVMVRVLEEPDGYAPAIVQVMGEGVPPVRDDRTIDFSYAPTFQAVRDHRRVLIQSDVVNAPAPATPPELVELYGIRAQMLHPLMEDDEFVGLLAAHQVNETRLWSRSDEQDLSATAVQIEGVLARFPRDWAAK